MIMNYLDCQMRELTQTPKPFTLPVGNLHNKFLISQAASQQS